MGDGNHYMYDPLRLVDPRAFDGLKDPDHNLPEVCLTKRFTTFLKRIRFGAIVLSCF